VEGTSEHQAQEGARRRATSTKGIACCVLAATVALMGVLITPAIHSLLLSTPPPPKRKNPPKTKTRQFPPKQKHTLLTKQNPQQIQSPLSLFFFLPPTPAAPWPSLARFQQLARRGTIQNSRNEESRLRTDEVPKPPVDSRGEEERRVVNFIKFKT
jgi:hypothetical protein